MLNKSIIPAAVSLLVLAASCNSGQKAPITEKRFLEDSTKYASLKMDIELPAPVDASSIAIREGIISSLDDQLTRITTYENEKMFPSYEGDHNDTDALLGYYKDQAFTLLAKEAEDDAQERIGYLMANDELSEEEFTRMVEETPRWQYEYSFEKIGETPSYVVYFSRNYIYMGGAHGGITGAGGLTFDKSDGHLVEHLIDPSSTIPMQSLLVKGLLSFYSDLSIEMKEEELLESLFIEDGIIPLPGWEPYPEGDSMVFIYQQYEIASYAQGMPSFSLPVNDLLPYLTLEAKAILGL